MEKYGCATCAWISTGCEACRPNDNMGLRHTQPRVRHRASAKAHPALAVHAAYLFTSKDVETFSMLRCYLSDKNL